MIETELDLSRKGQWIPYDVSHYTSDFCKEKAKELRDSGEFQAVRLGSYLKEDNRTFCKIYVIEK